MRTIATLQTDLTEGSSWSKLIETDRVTIDASEHIRVMESAAEQLCGENEKLSAQIAEIAAKHAVTIVARYATLAELKTIADKLESDRRREVKVHSDRAAEKVAAEELDAISGSCVLFDGWDPRLEDLSEFVLDIVAPVMGAQQSDIAPTNQTTNFTGFGDLLLGPSETHESIKSESSESIIKPTSSWLS
jgi:hypothetical protein